MVSSRLVEGWKVPKHRAEAQTGLASSPMCVMLRVALCPAGRLRPLSNGANGAKVQWPPSTKTNVKPQPIPKVLTCVPCTDSNVLLMGRVQGV